MLTNKSLEKCNSILSKTLNHIFNSTQTLFIHRILDINQVLLKLGLQQVHFTPPDHKFLKVLQVWTIHFKVKDNQHTLLNHQWWCLDKNQLLLLFLENNLQSSKLVLSKTKSQMPSINFNCSYKNYLFRPQTKESTLCFQIQKSMIKWSKHSEQNLKLFNSKTSSYKIFISS